jgi:putative nucleotidyltransferase with HDIG domain
MKTLKIPYELKKMGEIFKSNGFEAYLVGGAVRDMILGKNAADYDVATNAKPEDVIKIFKRVILTGIKHGTVTVHFMKMEIEVTTYRTEADYTDGRHPDKVEYTSSITEDLSRRDFTMNAIAINLHDNKIYDPFNGIQDIKNKIIRTCGNPLERFSEDGLRPVRAIRFASQLQFQIENNTLKAIPECLSITEKISVERFHDEFIKLMKSEKPSYGLKLFESSGILNIFIPELVECRGVSQTDVRSIHQFDVLDHLFYACDGAPVQDFDAKKEESAESKVCVRLAALFHDIGKVETRREEIRTDSKGDQYKITTFYNHEKISAIKTEKILKRLKFANTTVKKIVHLVKEHMFFYESCWTDVAVRRFIKRVSPETIPNLFDLRIADVYGMTNTKPKLYGNRWTDNLVEFYDRIKLELEKGSAITLKDLKINGKDLIQLGLPQGPVIGKVLSELFNIITDDPEMNDNQLLKEYVKKHYLLSI